MSTIETTSSVKVMLASPYEADKTALTFPKLASVKLDGIRCYVENGVAYSRNGKAIRNTSVQQFFADGYFDGFDGELLSGKHDEMVFRRTTSVVMAENGGTMWKFHVFDRYDMPGVGYADRLESIKDILSEVDSPKVKVVEHFVIRDEAELDEFEQASLDDGYEGCMIRNPDAFYKHGRATAKSQDLLKVKRFSSDEALVIGFEPLIRKDGTVEDLLGSLLLELPSGSIFGCGSGFTEAERRLFWKDKDSLIGKLARYSHFKVGNYDLPRFPTFDGFRDENDIS